MIFKIQKLKIVIKKATYIYRIYFHLETKEISLHFKKMNPELQKLCSGLQLSPLPENNKRLPNIAHAAKRTTHLSDTEKEVSHHQFYHSNLFSIINPLLSFNFLVSSSKCSTLLSS